MPNKRDITYEERRKHIQALIQDWLYWVQLTDLCKSIGRITDEHELRNGTDPKYQYVWQILTGYGDKQSYTVLDDLEQELRKRNLWVEYGNIELSQEKTEVSN